MIIKLFINKETCFFLQFICSYMLNMKLYELYVILETYLKLLNEFFIIAGTSEI